VIVPRCLDPAHLWRLVCRAFYVDRWNVGVVDAPIHQFLDPSFVPLIRWLPDRKLRSYRADPFLIVAADALTVAFEEYDFFRMRGRISSFTIKNGEVSAASPVIDNGRHMSYPYVVRHCGAVYLIPETWDRGELAIYSFDASARRWRNSATILSNFAAVDATLVRFDGRWWMFCGNQADSPMSKLYLWYSDDLFGPWRPHAANPVKDDVSCSRSGGTPFVHQGVLYRPAQDNRETYGGSIVVNRVVRLTTTAFREESVSQVRPAANGRYPRGLHTVAQAGGITLVDGRRRDLALHLCVQKVRIKLREQPSRHWRRTR